MIPSRDDDISELASEAFGGNTSQAKVTVVGDGISEATRISFDLLADPNQLDAIETPWSTNRSMIVGLFTSIFHRSRQCPGRAKPQCCQAEGERACFPNWKEREDPEWYAQEINSYLSMVENRLRLVTPTTAALAADEAFELGCLFTEALIKFRWDKHAKSGKKSGVGASRGGKARRRRPNVESTVAAVEMIIDSGKSKTRAYAIVAKQQGVSAQTIGNEYRLAKKQV